MSPRRPSLDPQARPPATPIATGWGGALAWLLPFGLLLLAIVVVPLLILDEEGLPRYRALRQELREVQTQNARMRHEVMRLQRQVEALRQDPSAIERIARDELGMLRQDEILFQFPH
jgi:cell division protein FtsB